METTTTTTTTLTEMPSSDGASHSTPPQQVTHDDPIRTPPQNYSFSPGRGSAFSTPSKSSLGEVSSHSSGEAAAATANNISNQDSMVALFLSNDTLDSQPVMFGAANTNSNHHQEAPTMLLGAANSSIYESSPERTRESPVVTISPERSPERSLQERVKVSPSLRTMMSNIPNPPPPSEETPRVSNKEVVATKNDATTTNNDVTPAPVAIAPTAITSSYVAYNMVSENLYQALDKLKGLTDDILSDEALARGAQTPVPIETEAAESNASSTSQFDLDKLYASDSVSQLDMSNLDMQELVEEIRQVEQQQQQKEQQQGVEEEKKQDDDIVDNHEGAPTKELVEINNGATTMEPQLRKPIPTAHGDETSPTAQKAASPDRSSGSKTPTRMQKMAQLTERSSMGRKILNSLASKSSPDRSSTKSNARDDNDDESELDTGLVGPPPIARETGGSMTHIMRLRKSPKASRSPKASAPTPVVTNQTATTTDGTPQQPEMEQPKSAAEIARLEQKKRLWIKRLTDQKREEERRQLTGGRQYDDSASGRDRRADYERRRSSSNKSSTSRKDRRKRDTSASRRQKRRGRRSKSVEGDSPSVAHQANCQSGIRSWLQRVLDERCGQLDDTYSIYDDGEESEEESSLESYTSDFDESNFDETTLTKRSSGEDESKGYSLDGSKGYSLDESKGYSMDSRASSGVPARRYSSDGSRSSHNRMSTASSALDSSHPRGGGKSAGSSTFESNIQYHGRNVPSTGSPRRSPSRIRERSVSPTKKSPVREERSPMRKARSPTREAAPEDDVGIQDKNFIHAFIAGATKRGIVLLLHKKQRKQAFSRPQKVLAFLQLGFEKANGNLSGPRLIWQGEDGLELGQVDLFDIRAIDKASPLDMENYPLAVPGRSLILRTGRGNNFVFEASNEGTAIRFCHGMKWVVARLAFNLIIGNVNVSCELFDIGEEEEDYDGLYRKSPQSPLEESRWTMAMNGLTNHLVDKSTGPSSYERVQI